jgi:hypothetical protein
MKVITVRPPWADAIACGAKRFETRSWPTSYRGALAIHAGTGDMMQIRAFLGMGEFQRALAPLVGKPLDMQSALTWCDVTANDVHRGAVVAVCRLENCLPTVDLSQQAIRREERLGDFSSGRYAWYLTGVVRLAQPVKWSGRLGLHNTPAAVRRRIVAALPAGAALDPVIRRALGA